MTRIKTALPIVYFLAALTVPFAAAHAADQNPVEALKACARIDDASERNACYDELGKKALEEEAEPAAAAEPPAPEAESATPAAAAPVVAESVAEPAPQPAPQPAAKPSPEDNPALQDKDAEKKKPIYGHVKACQQASDGNWFFILDNGDVWKQSGGKKKRFDDCDFDVVFRKDFFGYKMTIDGVEEPVRVRRHKR